MRAATQAVVVLIILFVAHQAFLVAIEHTALYRWQMDTLHWRYIHQSVFCIALPIAALLLLKRPPPLYGITWERKLPLAIVTILGLTILLPLAVDGFSTGLRPKGDLTYLASTLVFQIIFSGFGEELYCRGMVQGEVDRAAGTPYKIGTVRFAPGLFIGALYFGLGHLGIAAALYGGALHPWAFVYTTALGLLFGLVRAHTGSVFIAGALHAGIDTYWYLVTPGYGALIHPAAIGVAIFLISSGLIYPSPRSHARDGQ